MADLGFFGVGSDSSEDEEELVQVAKKVEETKKIERKSGLPAPEELLLIPQRSEFFKDTDNNGVNWNNDSLLRTAPRPPTPDPHELFLKWKSDMMPENTEIDPNDEKYFQDGQVASTMKGKNKRPKNVPDMAIGWSKQYGDGSAPKYANQTIREMADNPEDEKRVKIPKKRPQEGEQVTGIPEGAKGPKFSKKQITNETNRRNAARFGNMTDY